MEEASNTQRTPYLFTAKELDEETGLYYFGARYYDPRTSVWQSPDPILAKYIGGKGSGAGVFTPVNLNLYSYSHQRPVIMMDPDGKEVGKLDWTVYGAAGGAAGGAYVGATGGVACTVGAPACSPAGAGAGFVVGGLAGGAAGLAVDAAEEVGYYGGMAISWGIDSVRGLFNSSSESARTSSPATTAEVTQSRRESGNYVYRALREGENPSMGLFAGNPTANRSPRDHVRGGSRTPSQWISTSRNPDIAFGKYNSGNGVVKIDLNKIVSPYVDLSSGIPGTNPRDPANNFAIRDQEVLIYQYVPPSAITPLE